MKTAGMLRNSLAIWGAYAVSAASGFFLSPFIVHHLGNTRYAILVLIGSIVGYLGLLDLGVRGAIARFIASHHAREDHTGASETVAAAFRLFTWLGALALAFSIVLALLVNHLFEIPPGFVGISRLIIVLGGAMIALSFIGGVFGGILAGIQRFDLDSMLEISLTVIRVVLVIAVLSAGFGLVALALIHLGIVVLRGIVAWRWSRKLYPDLRLTVPGSTRPAMKQLLRFSLISSAIHVATQVIYYSDALVIGTFLPITLVTFYAIATNLAEYARQIAGAVARIVTPRVSSEESRSGMAGARVVVLNCARWVGFLTVPIAVTFALRGGRFIGLWMGPEYAELSGPVLSILAVTVWLAGGHYVSVSALMGVNRHRGLALAFGAQSVVNLGLSVLLIGPLQLVGVSIATVVSSIMLNIGYLPWYLHRVMGITPLDFARHAWLRPSIVTSPFALATAVTERYWVPESLFSFFGQTALLLPILCAAVYFRGLGSGERDRIAALGHAARLVVRRASGAG